METRCGVLWRHFRLHKYRTIQICEIGREKNKNQHTKTNISLLDTKPTDQAKNRFIGVSKIHS